MSATEGGGDTIDNNDSNMIQFDLYIKASAVDKETKGSCPICQQFFMMTCLLGEKQDNIDFKVYTVQADCPPKNFAAGWSKKYPVIMVNSGKSKTGQDLSGMMYDIFEELEQFFECINTECPELKRKNAPNIAAMQVVENLYKHFNHFIAGQSEKSLLAELNKLNDFLEAQDTIFLVDDKLSWTDCHLLPRLQHIIVAGKAYRNFEIPREFTAIWRYLKNAYKQEAFKSTMPSDQDIKIHYEKKAPPIKGSRGAKPTLEKFTYTMDIPSGILNGIDEGANSPAEEVEEQEQEPKFYSEPHFEPEQHSEPEPPLEPYFELKQHSEPDFAAADLASENRDHEEVYDNLAAPEAADKDEENHEHESGVAVGKGE